MYRSIGKGEATHEEVGQFFIKLLGKKTANWWFYVYITGTDNRADEETKDFEKLFRGLGFLENDDQFNQNALGQFAQGWGHNWARMWWKTIHDKIEAVNTL